MRPSRRPTTSRLSRPLDSTGTTSPPPAVPTVTILTEDRPGVESPDDDDAATSTLVRVALPPDLQQRAIDVVRGFALDAPRQANSGHPGTALALAPLAHVLFGRLLRHDP